MTEERALKIGLALQNIGYKVDDETLQKIKPFKDEIEAEILQEILEDKSASAEAYNEGLSDAIKAVKNYFCDLIENHEPWGEDEVDAMALIPNKEICQAIGN